MLKRTLALWLPVVITTTIFLGISDTEVSAKNRFISIGTGGPTGVYFVVGNAVCRMVHREAAEGRKKGRKHIVFCVESSDSNFPQLFLNYQVNSNFCLGLQVLIVLTFLSFRFSRTVLQGRNRQNPFHGQASPVGVWSFLSLSSTRRAVKKGKKEEEKKRKKLSEVC